MRERVSAALAAMSDGEILGLTDTAAGVPVFVKHLPLSRLELDHHGSTANFFELPMQYHYGIGSAGFGAWRELAALELTSAWAEHGFPVLHHWRVIEQPPGPGAYADVGKWAAHWHDDPAIRRRLEALAGAPARLTLVMQRLPYTMDGWLRDHHTHEWADAELRRGTEFMRARTFLHLDAHFDNLLTDGRRVYFGDLGLALHDSFDLDDEERAFLDRHRDYDVDYVRGHLNHWLARHGRPVIAANEEVARRVLGFWRRLEADRRTPYHA